MQIGGSHSSSSLICMLCTNEGMASDTVTLSDWADCRRGAGDGGKHGLGYRQGQAQ